MNAWGGRGRERIALISLLTSTSLGTISSTIMSSPINEISAGLRIGPEEAVLAVSAFTVAMVVFAPFAGWLCERLGPTRYLLTSLALMVLAQLGAALATGLVMLVVMRALQGIACSGIPPAVQQGLSRCWPMRRRQTMSSWAAAIGIGQAVGPPIGGWITELVGWRAVFAVHAAVCAVVLVMVMRYVPTMPGGPAQVTVGGLVQLVAGGGAVVTAATWAGQGGDLRPVGILLAVGVLIVVWALRPGRAGGSFLGDGIAEDPGFVTSTCAAAAAMAATGITMVSVPLYLGREIGLSAGVIGLATFAVAAGMAVFAPVAGRIAGRVGPRRTLAGGAGGPDRRPAGRGGPGVGA